MLIDTPTESKILFEIRQRNKIIKSDFLIFCGENVGIDYDLLITLLNGENIQFCGGIFPSVIYKKESYKDKVLILPILFEQQPIIVRGLDDGDIEIPSELKLDKPSSLFILTDGLSNWISKFIFQLYDEIGSDHQVFGSGAGFGSFERQNCLFTPAGFFMDAAIVVPVTNQIVQSTRHGWKPIAGPYIATKTSGNLLKEVNWESAYNVCKSIIEEQENVLIDENNYYKYAKRYPFGISRSDSEYLIRDPVSVESNASIKFGAEIPSNSVLYLMNSETDDMLLAGRDACMEVITKCNNPSFLFVADCISRTWLLNECFEQELNNIDLIAKEKNLPVYGVFSMGEISSSNGGLLDYHHKTIVISIVEKNE